MTNFLSKSPLFFIVGLILLLSACSNGKILPQSPDISVQGVEIVELGLDTQTFRFNLDAFNPNKFGLPLKGIDFVLKFSGITVGQGISDQSLTLAANAATTVPVLVSTNLLETRDSFSTILQGGGLNFDYEMSGKIQLLSSITSVPFSVKGNLLK